MSQEFNLIDEEWLPCLMSNGEIKSLSIRKVFAEAHDVQELLDASPLVTISLHRLLLAILHRALMGPVNMEAWKDLWNARRFEMTKLDAYLESYRPRFFLFDDNWPFYQVTKMEVKKTHPVQRLAQELSSGDNKAWFDHSQNDQPANFSAAEIARYLLATQAFALRGGQSEGTPNFSDAPLARDLLVLVRGDNLFETLMLNLVEYRNSAPFRLSSDKAIEDDKPIWEQNEFPEAHKASPQGYTNYLTWRSRDIHLIHSDGKQCQIRQRLTLDFQEPWDPFKCYRIGNGYSALQLDPQKAVWRDCHTLFQKVEIDSRKVKRPEIFNHLAQVEDLRGAGVIEAKTEYRFDILGQSADNAAVHLWRHERLPLPVIYLNSLSLWPKLACAIELAEKVWTVLRENGRLLAVFTLIPNWHVLHPDWRDLIRKWDEQKKAEDSKEDKLKRHKDISDLAKSFRHGFRYWSQLGALFPRLLKELAEDFDPATDSYGQSKLPEWADSVRAAAQDTFRQIAASIEVSDRGLRAVSLVEQNFEARLNIGIKRFKDDLR